jgi:putative transposase
MRTAALADAELSETQAARRAGVLHGGAADRGSDVLVREAGRLREAVREVRAERPFGIDAWVVLPDHMHAVWTLPEADADFSTRWVAIKARFSMAMGRAG